MTWMASGSGLMTPLSILRRGSVVSQIMEREAKNITCIYGSMDGTTPRKMETLTTMTMSLGLYANGKTNDTNGIVGEFPLL
jgi:hypothetical protein